MHVGRVNRYTSERYPCQVQWGRCIATHIMMSWPRRYRASESCRAGYFPLLEFQLPQAFFPPSHLSALQLLANLQIVDRDRTQHDSTQTREHGETRTKRKREIESTGPRGTVYLEILRDVNVLHRTLVGDDLVSDSSSPEAPLREVS